MEGEFDPWLPCIHFRTPDGTHVRGTAAGMWKTIRNKNAGQVSLASELLGHTATMLGRSPAPHRSVVSSL